MVYRVVSRSVLTRVRVEPQKEGDDDIYEGFNNPQFKQQVIPCGIVNAGGS